VNVFERVNKSIVTLVRLKDSELLTVSCSP